MSDTQLTRTPFGTTLDGTRVELFTLARPGGITVKIASYGARIVELHAPDRDGNAANITLGFGTLEKYLEPEPFFGATVGRVANRIARGAFTLDGRDYALPINNGPNTLHGGPLGFDKKVWAADAAGGNAVRFALHSPDGDQGFPGNVDASVTYTLAGPDVLRIDYEATCDAATPVNLTNHSYFNLSGAGRGDITAHDLQLAADFYTPVDGTLIPTGEVAPVAGTPMDFSTAHTIGSRLPRVKGGYDHNYVLRRSGGGELAFAARVHDPRSGRVMELSTTQPGVQFYSGNFLDGSNVGNGGAYIKHGGLCLETQHFPDSVHHDTFPSIILRPGETYRQTAQYRFTAQ